MDEIIPLILGRGLAGQAIAKALRLIQMQEPELKVGTAQWLDRGTSLSAAKRQYPSSILFVANPHGLHAQTIEAAMSAGFDAIVCEKPACVNMQEVATLRALASKAQVAVLHVYREMWGPRFIRELVRNGALGKLIAVEGR